MYKNFVSLHDITKYDYEKCSDFNGDVSIGILQS